MMRYKVLKVLCLYMALASKFGYAEVVRHALAIGNDSYPGNALHNARNDARSVSQQLTSLGYDATLLLDADRNHLSKAIDEFANHVRPGDVALFYYAGHGLQVDGENYLVPTDFRVSGEAEAKLEGYPLSEVLQKLTAKGATTQIIILDACRDNPFLLTRSLRGGWASLGTSAGTYLAFGTAPGSTASDDPDEGHGLFTKSVLKFMSEPDLDIDSLFQKVRRDVINGSHGQQVPWTASSLIGSFHMVPQADVNAPLLWAPRSMPRNRGAVNPSRTVRSGAGPIVRTGSDQTAQMIDEAAVQARSFHFNEAISILENVLDIDPNCAVAMRVLGVVLHLVGRSVEGDAALKTAHQLDPDAAMEYQYGCLLEAGKNAPSSEADCRNALSVGGDKSLVNIGLALNGK